MLNLLLKPACPRCGHRHIFKSFLGLEFVCPDCGLAFHKMVSDDGPAFFVLSVIATVMVILLIVLEVRYAVPLWQNLSIVGCLTIMFSLLLLRPAKILWLHIYWRANEEEILKGTKP